jgi:TctA family transporter
MMLFSPFIAQNALSFGPWEYFAVMMLGLLAASTIGTGSPVKGIAMVVAGVAFGSVGLDIHSGSERFTFGYLPLYDGIGLVPLVMGIFAVPEIIFSIRTIQQGSLAGGRVSLRSMIPTRAELRQSWMPMVRGTAVGSFFGALPGTGGMVASFMSYAMEKRVARDPSRFGRGAIEGVVGPEASNNAADQTAFIPTMTLGIPGSVTMAIVIGVMLTNGVTPGPTLITDQPQLFWGLIVSFWIGNVILVILNIPLIGLWVKLLMIPYRMLYPLILVFVCVGAFIVQGNSFDVVQVAFFGALGCAMRWAGLSGAPFILGFVLGPMMEVHLRRALVLSRGDFLPFIERPISAGFLAAALALLAWAAVSTLRQRARGPIVETDRAAP